MYPPSSLLYPCSRKTGLRCLSGAAAGAAAAPDPGVGGAMAEHVGADAQAGGRRKSVSWNDAPPAVEGALSAEEERKGILVKLETLDALRARGVLSDRDHALKADRLRAKFGLSESDLRGLEDEARTMARKRKIVHALEMPRVMAGVPEGVVFRLQALHNLRDEGRIDAATFEAKKRKLGEANHLDASHLTSADDAAEAKQLLEKIDRAVAHSLDRGAGVEDAARRLRAVDRDKENGAVTKRAWLQRRWDAVDGYLAGVGNDAPTKAERAAALDLIVDAQQEIDIMADVTSRAGKG